jgi:flagellar hook protein FlgE
MMRSMFSGVSGLRTHQTKMDVIAHNISNVNTVGFKSSRVTFNEVFSQTLRSGSGANETTGRGGTNPMQIGLGTNVSSIDKNMTTGATQRTDNALDLMINGDGFFIVGDNSGTYFTRAGAFEIGDGGYITTGNGMRVYGWDTKTDADGTVGIQKDRAQPIRIAGEKEYVSPTTTKNIDFAGNINTLAITQGPDPKRHTMSVAFYDSLGNRYVMDADLEYLGATAATGTEPGLSSWKLSFRQIEIPNSSPAATAIAMYPNGDRSADPVFIDAIAPLQITFNDSGKFYGSVETTAAATAPIAVTGDDIGNALQKIIVDPLTTLAPPATFGTAAGEISLDFKGLTQFGTENTSAKSAMVDGNAPGTLQGLSVGSDGKITGRYSNGETKLIGQIPIAIFKNPAGMEKIGENLYVPTANSGDFDGVGQETGDIMGGVLEMSNVDLSSEFTEMITTQRGFQANSRLITTSDDMLQELVNLKR